MTWYPGAERREVTRHQTPIVLMSDGSLRGTCNHIAVTEASSLFNYFNQPGSPTSHFYVTRTGPPEQYVSIDFRAPAQLDGNPTLVSLETQGGTEANCAGTWNEHQLAVMADIHAWLHDIRGLPLQMMPNSLPGSRGAGYHRLGVDPYRVNGGELWSSAYGKICPCPNRIAQLPGMVVQAQQIAAGGDDFMATMTEAQLNQFLYDVNQTRINTSLTATRLDSLVNSQFPALRADVAAMRQSLSLVEIRMDNVTNSQFPEARQTLAAIQATLTLIEQRMDYLANNAAPAVKADVAELVQSLVVANTQLASIAPDVDRIGDWAAGPDATGGPGE
jgi:hypothetical protein